MQNRGAGPQTFIILEPCREGDSLGGGVIPRFLRARSEQLDAKGEVESVRRQQTRNRKALEDQIVENALALASTVVRSSVQAKKSPAGAGELQNTRKTRKRR